MIEIFSNGELVGIALVFFCAMAVIAFVAAIMDGKNGRGNF